MTFATATIPTTTTPARDLMTALRPVLQAGGLSLVDSWATVIPSSWSAVAYGGAVFVTVASGTSTAATSPDGAVWTQRNLPVASTWSTITYGGGQFVALATNTTIAATSPDGITWTQRTLPVSGAWTSVTYGGTGLFVAVSSSGGCVTSPDGITWTQRTMSSISAWTSVTYGAGVFVAAAANAAFVSSSPDGITWTQRNHGSSPSWQAITYGNGKFVVVASGSTTVATSTDGLTWSVKAMTGSAGPWQAITFTGSVFVATSNGSTLVATSTDGLTWTQQNAMPATASWNALTYGGGTLVAVASGSTMAATSPDAATWTARALTATSLSTAADVYRSPGTANAFGTDWFLILRRLSDVNAVIQYQVCESYDPATHRASTFAGVAQAVAPLPVSYANPLPSSTPDAVTVYPGALSLSTTGFTYYISVTADRMILSINTSTFMCYAGLYDDLLPAGTTGFPLVLVRSSSTQSGSTAIGSGSAQTAGGFTREPLQTAVSNLNFEAAIHNGLWQPIATTLNTNHTPMTSTGTLYGNAGTMSRVLLGSLRSASTADATRGLLIGCWCSVISSAQGDTATIAGKTYFRMGGPVATFGYWVDQSL